MCSTVDPLAGSYYVESLTNEIEKQAAAYIEKIDTVGGMLGAIESGFVQREIQEASVAFQERVDSGERIIVGLNAFHQEEDRGADTQDLFVVDSSVETIQREKLAALRQRRESERVADALKGIGRAVENDENLMPYIIDAVKGYATVGEICNLLRQHWGEYQAPIYI